MMKIYNSLSSKKEEFIPIEEGKITMYVCGPTVYNYVHIGNMRPPITFDMVYNYFKYLGYDVKYASNFTDINEKISIVAKENGICEREVADKFTKAYLEDLKNYNCSSIDYRPKVTEHLQDIFNFIQELIKKGYAYEVDGNVYFRVEKVKQYGILSKQDITELKNGIRKEVDLNKESPLDFALWRKTTDIEQFDSPWGKGIPGWHTECVVMIDSIFNGKIDIHGGGVDLKFPHHENEIAQSLACNGHTIANYWMHNGHINLNGEKMSKSLGNYILAKDFIKKHDINVIRIALFKTHYRLPINFNDSLFEEADNINLKIINSLKQANLYGNVNNLSFSNNVRDKEFEEIMNDDFNTPNAISYLLELVKGLNQSIRSKNSNDVETITNKILTITKIFGLSYNMPKLSVKDLEIYNNWNKARENKDFEKADEYRKKLIEKNIL